jgi:hypothetical protein
MSISLVDGTGVQMCVCVCVCVLACARARACVCVCVCVETQLVESLAYIKAGENLTDYLSTSHKLQLFGTRW